MNENDNHVPNFDPNEEDVEIWLGVTIKGKEYDKYAVSSKGKIYSHTTNKLLDGRICRGYNVMKLRDEDRNIYNTGRHRIVAEQFCENPDNKEYVNHKDGNKLNNNPSNLEWVTAQENTLHAIDHGLIYTVGDKSHLASIDEATAIRICEMIVDGKLNLREIADELGVGYDCVKKINKGKSWRHLSSRYGII